MPYIDPEKQKKAMRKVMRDRRKRIKEETKTIIDKYITTFPKQERKRAKQLLTKAITALLIRFDEKEQEIDQYAKQRINQFYDKLVENVRERLEIEKIIIKEKNK